MKRSYKTDYLQKRYDNFVKETIVATKAKFLCDIGGGRTPRIKNDFIQQHNLDYTLLDISQDELDKAPATYHKICADIGQPSGALKEGQFDICFSRMVAEHIKDGARFHSNIHKMLKEGGLSIHFFPTLYTVPFVVNKLIPESLSRILMSIFQPQEMAKGGKFPAFYSRTYGPTDSQIQFLSSLGFEVLLYGGGYGHLYYKRVPVLRNIAQLWWDFCRKREVYHFTSCAVVVLRKKSNPGGSTVGPVPLPEL